MGLFSKDDHGDYYAVPEAYGKEQWARAVAIVRAYRSQAGVEGMPRDVSPMVSAFLSFFSDKGVGFDPVRFAQACNTVDDGKQNSKEELDNGKANR